MFDDQQQQSSEMEVAPKQPVKFPEKRVVSSLDTRNAENELSIQRYRDMSSELLSNLGLQAEKALLGNVAALKIVMGPEDSEATNPLEFRRLGEIQMNPAKVGRDYLQVAFEFDEYKSMGDRLGFPKESEAWSSTPASEKKKLFGKALAYRYLPLLVKELRLQEILQELGAVGEKANALPILEKEVLTLAAEFRVFEQMRSLNSLEARVGRTVPTEHMELYQVFQKEGIAALDEALYREKNTKLASFSREEYPAILRKLDSSTGISVSQIDYLRLRNYFQQKYKEAISVR